MRDFLERRGGDRLSPGHATDPADARRAFSRLQSTALTASAASTEDRTFPVGPTGAVDVRILRPQGVEGCLPLVLYLHGGGWVMGGKDTHDRLMRELAVDACVVVLFVDYTLAPDARYPIQNEQAYAALEHVVANAGPLRIDASRIAVAGDCAGGNMAAAVALIAKQRRGPAISFQLLFYPFAGDPTKAAATVAFEDGPWLTLSSLERWMDAVFPDESCRREITAFPMNASAVQLNDLPEALVIVAENDVMRDEGEAYARRLIEAGVTVTCTRYNGTIHDFVVLNALSGSATTRNAIAQAAAALHAALHER